MYCPKCTKKLEKKPKQAENVWHCKTCDGTFYILTLEKEKPGHSYTVEMWKRGELVAVIDKYGDQQAIVEELSKRWPDYIFRFRNK